MKKLRWPSDRVTRKRIKTLVPYAKNARTHSAEQIEQIKKSIEKFGFTIPVLIDEKGGIIAGHGRVMAASAIGLLEVPVMIAKGWSPAQKRAYVIADNKIALNAGWDDDLLRSELDALRAANFDLGSTGFDEVELADLFNINSDGLNDPDEVPPPPSIPVSTLGDLWILGGHRVICGDCTDAAAVKRLLDGARPGLMVTDPPYGVDYDPAWRDRALGGKAGGRATGRVNNDGQSDWREAWALFSGEVVYCWSSGRYLPESILSLEAAGFERRALIVWAKSTHTFGRGHYHSQEEECWYAVRKGASGNWRGDRKQTTLWQIDRPQKSETGHGTQKPVECMRRPIINNSKPGDAIYEPFCGSGTTIIAAQMEKRRCFAVEIDPVYIDVIVQRWQKFTGLKAILDGSKKTFEEVAKERKRGKRKTAARAR